MEDIQITLKCPNIGDHGRTSDYTGRICIPRDEMKLGLENDNLRPALVRELGLCMIQFLINAREAAKVPVVSLARSARG